MNTRIREIAAQSDILYLLHGADQVKSAYDILAMLRRAVPRLAPMTVYRALKTLWAKQKIPMVRLSCSFATNAAPKERPWRPRCWFHSHVWRGSQG